MPHTPSSEGLAHDLPRLAASLTPAVNPALTPTVFASRRAALRWLGAGTLGAGAPLTLLGCGGGSDDSSAGTSVFSDSSGSSSSPSSASGTCSVIPTETAGPYPADGSLASSQRLNALTLSGIVRSDIRTSVGSASGTAAGVPLTVTLTLVNTNGSCASLAGYAIYLWHCTRDGGYSLYSSGYTGENFLRGVQVTDSNGQVTFTTVFPGCYSGRWPHIHFEIYPSLEAATDAGTVSDYAKVSQLALPAAACNQVYGVASGYSASVSNFAAISLASDNIFSDGVSSQLATVSGDATNGFAATLTVGIAA